MKNELAELRRLIAAAKAARNPIEKVKKAEAAVEIVTALLVAIVEEIDRLNRIEIVVEDAEGKKIIKRVQVENGNAKRGA